VQILARVRNLVVPPEFPDEEETRVAATVHRIGLAFVPLALLGALVIVTALPRPLPPLSVAFGFIGMVVVSLWLARRGHVMASARLFVACTWLSLAAGLVVSRDVSTPAVSGFVLSIAAAGLLLGSRSAYAVALISALAPPTVMYFDIHFGTPAGPSGLSRSLSDSIAIVQASIFFASAALVSVAVRHAERSRALARLSEARFRAIADQAPDMITEADADGHFTYANPMALAASRLPSVEELARERVGVWMHPDDAPAVIEKFRELARVGGSTRASFRAIDAQGRVSWFEATGARYIDPEGRTRVVSVTRDITRHREAEEALRESEARYRLLAEHAPDMISEFDAEGNLVYANSRMIESLGFSFEEFKAMTAEDRMHPDDVEACRRSFFETVAHGGPSRIVHRMRRRDGSYVWVAASGARHISARGAVHVIVQARDLTEELSLQEQLRESQKMDAIGRLAGGVAHDFNNLLTVIGGYASVLEGSLGTGAAAAAAHEIVDATERAAGLTRQLLLLTRRQLAQPGVVDLNAAVRSLEPILRSILPERIGLELALEPELPAVEIDPSQLDQVLINLALNARDAMPGGGHLRIETATGTLARFVHLKVSDTGHGMDEETRARAFEPFFTTKPAGEGTGLGLSTTYGIVRQTGGTISLHSELGRGTRVEISLPACAARPSPAKRRERSTATAGGRDASILLVEDDASVRRLLAILLESAGYRVTAAADAAEALAIVSESQRRFDLLLSDYVMPGLSGLELANTLRATLPELRVVLMTGHAEIPGSAVAELPRGAELLAKPFTREQLQRVIIGMLAAV
jgi:two-component system cell cycle sensor histidine kinase/response regulator CckA